MLIILSLVDPYSFGHSDIKSNKGFILIVFVSTFFIPAVAVLLMKAMDMIESIQMKDRQERIGPYIITGIFYLWLFVNLRQNPNVPESFKFCLLGATIGLFLAFLINLFSKISMHTTGMGGLLAMSVITVFNFSKSTFWLPSPFGGAMELNSKMIIFAVLIVAGLVGTSRLLLKAHEPQDIYGGYLVGMLAQFAAFAILI